MRRTFGNLLRAVSVLAALAVAGPVAAEDWTLTIVDGVDVKDWDPAYTYGHETYVLNNVYEPLLRYNTSENRLEPALATEWSVSADGLVWTFKLRPDVKYHGGEAFTAASVKAALARNIELGQGAQFLWGGAKVEALDDLTLTVATDKPLPIDLIASGMYTAMIYSADAATKGTEWFQKGNADGTGPYKVVQWVPNQQIVLERNEEYWGGWEGGEVDRVVVKIVSEVSTQLQMMRSGEADLTFSGLPFDMVETLRADGSMKVEIADSWQSLIGFMNTRKAPTDNLKFRQALAHLMDYEAVANHIYAGLGTVPVAGAPRALPGVTPLANMPKFDLERAKALLEESGVPKDQWKVDWVAYGGIDVLRNVALLFQANAAKAGVTVEIVQGEFGVMWDKQKELASSANVFGLRWWPDYATMQPSPLFKTQDPINFNLAHYSNPAVDRLIDEGTRLEAIDKAGSAAAWTAAYQQVVDDAAAMFLVDTSRVFPHTARIRFDSPDPAYETVFFKGIRKVE